MDQNATVVPVILIRWIVIYPVDSVIQRLNNPGQVYTNKTLNMIELITTGPKLE